jgi:hypothetical protein
LRAKEGVEVVRMDSVRATPRAALVVDEAFDGLRIDRDDALVVIFRDFAQAG